MASKVTFIKAAYQMPDVESLSVEIVRAYYHLTEGDQIRALAHILPRFDAVELSDILADIRQSFQPVSTETLSNVIEIGQHTNTT